MLTSLFLASYHTAPHTEQSTPQRVLSRFVLNQPIQTKPILTVYTTLSLLTLKVEKREEIALGVEEGRRAE